MRISELNPLPNQNVIFRRDKLKFVPSCSGCYILATFDKVVLYVGLTKNLCRRMGEHLDDRQKTQVTEKGVASHFFWCVGEEINRIERTWINTHIQLEGSLPILNKINSPVST